MKKPNMDELQGQIDALRVVLGVVIANNPGYPKVLAPDLKKQSTAWLTSFASPNEDYQRGFHEMFRDLT